MEAQLGARAGALAVRMQWPRVPADEQHRYLHVAPYLLPQADEHTMARYLNDAKQFFADACRRYEWGYEHVQVWRDGHHGWGTEVAVRSNGMDW